MATFKILILTPDKELNILIYGMSFYIIIYRSCTLKNGLFFCPPRIKANRCTSFQLTCLATFVISQTFCVCLYHLHIIG